MIGHTSTTNGGIVSQVTACLYNESAFTRTFRATASVAQGSSTIQAVTFQRTFPSQTFTCHLLTGFNATVAPGAFRVEVSYNPSEADNLFLGLPATDSGEVFDVQIGSARPPSANGLQGSIPIRGVGIKYRFAENDAPPPPPAPTAPSSLQASAPTPSQVVLTWQDTSANEDHFHVEQLIGGTFQEIGTTAANATTATVGNLLPDIAYSFRVRASNATGFSAYSNTATVTTPAAPAPQPPAGSWLTTNQLPGFQFKVRINGGALGTQVADCVPETLCVAGAIPTRSELFLRIIGPRPNGFLWSQVIRFSPSRLEVWVQRTSGGPIRYYDLPAVPVESSTLDGLVDKEAFQP